MEIFERIRGSGPKRWSTKQGHAKEGKERHNTIPGISWAPEAETERTKGETCGNEKRAKNGDTGL